MITGIRLPEKIKGTKKLGNPLFLLSVVLLIANDWFFKFQYGNLITGKLSDVAGLFAFPYLLSVLVPSWKKQIHFGTGLLFLFWKSELSTPLIDLICAVGIPVHRIIDFTDLVALVSVMGSYFALRMNYSVTSSRRFLLITLIVSSLSFMATTMRRQVQPKKQYVTVDKQYPFEISTRQLVSRLNALQVKEVHMLSKMSGGQVDFDAEKKIFHYHDSADTLALILDHSKVTGTDTIVYKSSYVRLIIFGDENSSVLKLVSVYQIFPAEDTNAYRDKAIRVFERKVIKKLRRMPDPYEP